MYPLELIQSARLITDVCMKIAPGEDVLCIADREEYMEVITLIAAECKARGAEVAVVLLERRREINLEPPRSVARAMQAADAVIVMAYGSLVHTKARREACAAGVRYGSLGGTTPDFLAELNLTRQDLLEVRDTTERIAQRLTAASSAHLTTRAGTDLRMNLEGRSGVALTPFVEKGSFSIIPGYAEATCPPLEDAVEGVAVVDGNMVGAPSIEGLVEQPFEIHFDKGRIVRISGGKDAMRLERLLDISEDVARTFAELGVNSNNKVPKKLVGTRTDNGIAGHVHLGLGRNDHIGGKTIGEAHLDVLVTHATLLLDDHPIIEDGNLKL